MDRWNELTARAQARHGAIVMDDLARVGATRAQVEAWEHAGRLVSVGYGAFHIAGAPPTFDARVLATVEAFPGECWASHRTAARLFDLGIACPDGQMEVTRPNGLSACRSTARVHRSSSIPTHHRTTVRGIPCLTVPRTFFDLARTVQVLPLQRAIDLALMRDRCTIGSLWRVLYDLGGRGRPGTRRLRVVLESLGVDHVPPSSVLEAVGMALLKDEGFEWQVELGDDRGYIRRVDGLRRSDGLIVEFDGQQHQREPQRSLDIDHDGRLRAIGHQVVRLTWADVTFGAQAALDRVAVRARS